MEYQLITQWHDYQDAIDRLLPSAVKQICLYDEDLAQLRLDSPQRLAALQRFLHADPQARLQIAVRNPAPLQRNNPQLLKLLSVHSHQTVALATPPELAALRDSMLLVDGRHGLIRFDREQARSKLLFDDSEAVRPYGKRFEEIIQLGGEALAASPLGL